MTMYTAALKILFSLLTCVIAAALAYTFAADYLTSCFDPHNRWMQAGLVEFLIDISFIIAWFCYKESRWILRVLFIFILFWLGSTMTCAYIVYELFKLSPQESSKDPTYFVLVRHQKRDAKGYTWRAPVVTVRAILVLLGCLMLGALVFAFVNAGFPFRAEVFLPCLVPLVIDLLIMRLLIFPMWVAHKESSWISAFAWIVLIICFGSMAMCAYVVRELFYLSPGQPVFLILFNKREKDLMLTDPLLTEHDNV